MPISYGVTPQGFVVKPLSVCEQQIDDKLKAAFGQYINTLPAAIFGQIKGLWAGEVSDVWSMSQSVYNARDPNTASGVALDKTVAINAVKRLPATYTRVAGCALTGAANTTIPAGKQALVQGSLAPFALDVDVTLDGFGNGTGNFTAVNDGPIACPANSLTIINTPVVGWNTINNPSDGLPGTNIETDDQLRARRLDNIENAEAGPLEAIRKKILTVTGITQCVGRQNVTSITDLNGLPPHSVNMFVLGTAAPADIAEALWQATGGGIQTVGGQSYTITDSMGQPQTMYWDNYTQKNVYGIANVTTNPNYPGDGDTQVKLALVNYINSLIGGQELIVSPQLISQVVGIAGIENIQLLVGFSPSPTMNANLPAAFNEIIQSNTTLWTINDV